MFWRLGSRHKYLLNKKVLLHERKKHTACRVPSTHCAALSNPDLVGGTGSQVWGGYPIPGPGGYPVPGPGWVPHPRSGGYPIPGGGVPHPDLGWGTPPTWTWDGVPHYLDLRWGTSLPRPGMGYPPT